MVSCLGESTFLPIVLFSVLSYLSVCLHVHACLSVRRNAFLYGKHHSFLGLGLPLFSEETKP